MRRSTGRIACAIGLTIVLAVLIGCSTRSTEGTISHVDSVRLPKLSVSELDMVGSGGSFRTLKLREGVEASSSSLPVYRVVSPNVTGAGAAAQARKLGIQGDIAETDVDFRVKGTDGRRFRVDKGTGSFDYTTPEFELQTEPLRVMLTDAEYRERAEEFLVSMGLMPENATFHDVNRGNVVGTYEDGKKVARPYMIEVRFSHMPLGKVRFDAGVGPKVIVQFADEGRLTGAMSVWRDVELDRTYPLISVDQAVDQIKANKAETYDVAPDADGIIEHVDLAYVSDPLGYEQEHVIPYFVMKGKDTKGRPFVSLTRAVSEEYLAIKQQKASQAPRSTSRSGRD